MGDRHGNDIVVRRRLRGDLVRGVVTVGLITDRFGGATRNRGSFVRLGTSG